MKASELKEMKDAELIEKRTRTQRKRFQNEVQACYWGHRRCFSDQEG